MANPNARLTDWDATWNSVPLGLLNKVKPDIKIEKEPIKRGTTGKHILGHFITAGTMVISAEIPAPTLAIVRSLCPWFTSGQVNMLPTAMNVNLYTYVQTLTLHPHDVPIATTTEDNIFPKAVPMWAFNLERDGDKEEIWTIEFIVYPDFDQLIASPPVVSYGYIKNS